MSEASSVKRPYGLVGRIIRYFITTKVLVSRTRFTLFHLSETKARGSSRVRPLNKRNSPRIFGMYTSSVSTALLCFVQNNFSESILRATCAFVLSRVSSCRRKLHGNISACILTRASINGSFLAPFFLCKRYVLILPNVWLFEISSRKTSKCSTTIKSLETRHSFNLGVILE
jgi:hypothetical protein